MAISQFMQFAYSFVFSRGKIKKYFSNKFVEIYAIAMKNSIFIEASTKTFYVKLKCYRLQSF